MDSALIATIGKVDCRNFAAEFRTIYENLVLCDLAKGVLSMRIMIATLALTMGAWRVSGTLDANRPTGADTRVYELRTYYAAPGKMADLHARFRDHTCKLFEKHGMKIEGFWSPMDEKQAAQKMIYLLSFPSKDAAAKCWKDFGADPDWKTARNASEKNGKLVTKLESVYMQSTDYSPASTHAK